MATVQIKSDVSLDTEQLLEGIAQLDTPELTRFLSMVGSILANRSTSTLPASETALIQQINQGLSVETQQRYDELQAKLRNETISPAEHEALLALVDVVELASAEKAQAFNFALAASSGSQ